MKLMISTWQRKTMASLKTTILVRCSCFESLDFEIKMPLKLAKVKQNRFSVVFTEKALIEIKPQELEVVAP
jgi:hypothetical protein